MTIYLIEGETGTYNDVRTWIGKTFTNKQLAQTTMEAWQKFADEHYHNRFDTSIIAPDPHFAIDYTGTTYNLIERELITDKFTEFVLGGITCTYTH